MRALKERNERLAADLVDHREEADAFLVSGRDDPELDRELVERLATLEAERDAIYAELRRLDPAFTAGMN